MIGGGLAVYFLAWRIPLAISVSRQIDSIKRSAQPTNPAEINRWLPGVPDSENGALVLNQAFSLLQSLPDVRSNQIDKAELLSVNGNWDAPTRQMILDYLDLNALALDKAKAALKFEKFRFPVDYSFGPDTLLPHLGKTKVLARAFSFRAAVAAESQRQTGEAVTNIEQILKLGATLDEDPTVIALLVRDAIYKIGETAAERTLRRARLSDADLEHLQNAFARSFRTNTLPFALAAERAMIAPVFRLSHREMQRWSQELDSAGETRETQRYTGKAFLPLWISGFFERDLNFYLGAMQTNITLASLPPPANLALGPEVERAAELAHKKRYILSSMTLLALGKIAYKENSTRAYLSLAQTACAVERFRNTTGGLPATLSELNPHLLKEIPNDPFDGKPLRYKRLPVGYVLYSVDADGEDNDGREPPSKKKFNDKTNYDITFKVER